MAPVALLGVLVGMIFLQEPSLGDDIEYWRLALGFHGPYGEPWGPGFHALRWPIWGACWLLQFVFGTNPAGYYGVPVIYLAAGGVVAFALGREIFGSVGAGWCAALLLIFHPILDPSITRPMPDLPEGVWSAAAFLAWLKMMRAEDGRGRLLYCALCGLAISTVYANRITGIFVIPSLIVCTLIYYRERFWWLVAAGGFALGFVAVEALIYYGITGDFLHSLHANLEARGKKGTEPVPLWYLPFRFLPSLWDNGGLKAAMTMLAAMGLFFISQMKSRAARVVPFWALTVYLCYSCGVQSFDPPRPLVRDGDRFISALAFPLALLGAAALLVIGGGLKRLFPRLESPGAKVAMVVLAVPLLALGSARPFFDLGFFSPMRRYLAEIPPGSKVLTEPDMRDLCIFVNGTAATKLDWLLSGSLLNESQELAAMADRAEYLAYNRKSMWTSTRKRLERREVESQPPIPSFLAEPFSEWQLDAVFPKDSTPDITFLSRRPAGAPAPSPVPAAESFLGPYLPQLPGRWEGFQKRKIDVENIPIPPEWRGHLLRVDGLAAADTVEALSIRLTFPNGVKLTLKPYLFPEPAIEFFAFAIPREAETMDLRIEFQKGDHWIALERLRLWLGPPTDTRWMSSRRHSDGQAADD